MTVRVTCPAEGCKLHRHQFDEKEGKDGHEGDSFSPVVRSDGSGQAWVGEGVACRS